MNSQSATVTTDSLCCNAAVLISACFEARTQAHFIHLQTRSFAEHKALNEFYDTIVTLADAYAESYQGCYGVISNYPDVQFSSTTSEDLIEELTDLIEHIRFECGSKSQLQNAIDSILELCNSTVYKISTLK